MATEKQDSNNEFVPESVLVPITDSTRTIVITAENGEDHEVEIPFKRINGVLDLETGTLTYYEPEVGTQ